MISDESIEELKHLAECDEERRKAQFDVVVARCLNEILVALGQGPAEKIININFHADLEDCTQPSDEYVRRRDTGKRTLTIEYEVVPVQHEAGGGK